MSIPFTDRELTRAWRQMRETASPLADQSRNNAHRLLLFYAVECGLKAVWLKRRNRTLFTKEDIQRTGHDLSRTLDQLKAGKELSFPQDVRLQPVKGIHNQTVPRNGGTEILHQAWRYGGVCESPNDIACEQRLVQVLEWINGELR